MWRRCRRACLILPGLILLTTMMYGSLHAVGAQDGASWLQAATPKLDKVIDLPDNLPPDSRNADCSSMVYTPAGTQDGRTVCTFASPLGVLTAESDIQTGPSSFSRLIGPTGRSYFVPTPSATIAVVSLESQQAGNYVGVYHHLIKTDLQQDTTEPDRPYYVTTWPDEIIRNPDTHERLQLSIPSIAYSADGHWMAVNMPTVGLVRVDMHDLSAQLFAPAIEPEWYLGVAAPPLAISNDGRYVAANTDIFGRGNLNIYDLSACNGPLIPMPFQHHNCASKNIWPGLLGSQADMTYPTHVRFVNDNTISFSARYKTDGAHFKAAVFTATAAGASQHTLGLLGMGDSYISGQGAFSYANGTDTKNNSCHVSQLAYPFILGAKDFNSYQSIACSGAVTVDIAGTGGEYVGQVKDRVKEKERDKQDILSGFLPGYIYQAEFASTYQPEAILLSVGGDDIGFADIVKACVANEGGGTCYGTYEDRAELVNEINATYPKLVSTYTALRQQSGGARLYVVGYPQIAAVGGDCGLNVHLNAEEVGFAAQLITYLDDVVRQAAQTAGVFYVDTAHAFDGHRLCEPGSKAMNGLTAGGDAGVTVLGHSINFIGAESYHPTVLGYRLLANVIAAQTADLMAPMPAMQPYKTPQLDAQAPILQNIPRTGRIINVSSYDTTIADNVAVRGETQPVAVNGAQAQLRPGSAYQAVLHSDPILLTEGSVDEAGNIAATVNVPVSTTPGYHVLHIYGTNMAGQSVDIQKAIYVAASLDDYDGDGVPNSANPCVVLSPSGEDADRDGIDDACDPEVSVQLAGAAAADKIVVDQGIASAAISGMAEGSGPPSAVLSGGQVLGSSASHDDHVSSGLATTSIPKHNYPQLFRVNWWAVLKLSGVITAVTTGLYYSFWRR